MTYRTTTATSRNWRALYPFDSHFADIDGHRLHYLDEGSGPTLLLVHGNPTWSFYWRNLIAGLRDEYRVVVPDHIGCGLSDKPGNYPYCLARHTENLVELIDQLQLDQVTLLAHDWGGAIGLGAALARTERFRRFVLFNTGAFPPWFIPWRIRFCRVPIFGRLAVQSLNLFARAALRMATSKHERITPQVRAGLLAPYDSWSNRNAIFQFVKDIPSSRNHPTYIALSNLESQLPTIADRPMMLVWGMRDWCFRPECLDKFLEIFPGAEVHRFDDAGHYVIEDAPERILPLVQSFLTRNAIEQSAPQLQARSEP
jgi:haloalkane dehalogenase